jgi:beta-galactosidase
MLDVVGTNYRPDELVTYHKNHPKAATIGTEDNYRMIELSVPRDNPSLSGTFTWTGIDYLGEGRLWPAIMQGFGMVDRTNEPRIRAYERQAWWTTKPMCRIGIAIDEGRTTNDIGGSRVMSWTPPNLEAHPENVEVYSNAASVELLLNDKSLGTQEMPKDVVRKWTVRFEPGTLKAVARDKGGNVVATDELKTAGAAVKVRLTVDQAALSPAWDDVAYVRAALVDANGVVNENVEKAVTFELSGPGVIAAVDNADLNSHESFRGNMRTTYGGKCIAILKATGTSGKIVVTAKAAGLADGQVTLEAVSQAAP